MKSTWFRIALDVVLALCVVSGWWYIALPLGIIALLKFDYFAEFIVAGFAYDALFGMGSFADIGFVWAYAGTIVTVICSGTIALMKNSIR